MSTVPDAGTARPSTRSTVAAFLIGLLVGTVLVAPLIPPLLDSLPSPSSFGPVGVALVVGVLSIVAFVFGLVSIYLGLVLAEGG